MTLCATRPDLTTLKRTVAPTLYALTKDEAQRHLRLTDEDIPVTGYLASATADAESFCERALLTQTYTLKLDEFWSGDLELPKPPLQSVTSIVYATDSGTSTSTVATTVYEVDSDSEPGRIRLKPDQSWPTDIYDRANAVTITFVAGWTSEALVPSEIKQAVRMILGHFEKNAEGVVTGTIATELPLGIVSLLTRWRMPWD